ncbi:DUF2235 domain-containing protein [Candidatus Halobeggiatoa sp. HSG11]|nr:DUF2235 domain-containing protein [Candidatus Halobeggiatoa sp. HSG11]
MKKFLLILTLIILNGCNEIRQTQIEKEKFESLYKNHTDRNLLVFMDGTGNDKSTNTNIYQMYELSVKKANKGTAIIPFYIQGVGTHWYDQIRGGTMGEGLNENICLAYKLLVENYKEGDKIFIFGFSRGAYSSRSLNGLIEFSNLLDINKIDADKLEDEIDSLFEVYNDTNDGRMDFEKRLRKNIEEKFKNKMVEKKVVVTAIGVFDTVPALGIKRDDFPDDHRTSLYAKKGFHALSLDEQRYDFRLLRFDPNKVSSEQTLKEVWFSGAHANVGGGYGDSNGLESIARNWMLNEFAEYDIFDDVESIDCTKPATCEYGVLHDEFLDSPLFDEFGISRRRPQHHNDFIHGNVICRIEKDTPLDKPHKVREPNGKYLPFNLKMPIKEHYQILPFDCN